MQTIAFEIACEEQKEKQEQIFHPLNLFYSKKKKYKKNNPLISIQFTFIVSRQRKHITTPFTFAHSIYEYSA